MREVIRRLALGLLLIGAAAGLLLLSDLGSRAKQKGAAGQGRPGPAKVALLQHASQSILEEGRQGMVAGMAERGWKEGENLTIRHFNAEGDNTVSQAIAREMVNAAPNLLLTISTPSLQAVANANRNTRIPHVFGLVTNPMVTGVGITSPHEHPAWLAGFGSMQPVAQAFDTARSMNPDLKTVGVIWNAAEANAEAQVSLARAVCAERGMTLLETTVDSSAGVGEAAGALIARGAEALWVCGDVTVMTAIDALVAPAKRAGIPVFTVIPPSVKRGTLFDLGADYFEVGRITGRLAGEILNGKDPATVDIQNVMPEVLAINLQALEGLKGNWKVPDALREKATLLIDEQGGENERAPRTGVPRAEAGKSYRLALAYYVPEPSRDACERGLLDGLKDLGFDEGKNLKITRNHAQGEISNIRPILLNLKAARPDALVTFSTPVLQGAIAAIHDTPVVFTYVIDPIAAGAGKSFTDHLPNVTGVGSMPPVAETVQFLKQALPHLKSIGTLYNDGEANSVKVVSQLREACKVSGVGLVELTAGTTADVTQAAQALIGRGIGAIYLPNDNTAYQALDAVVRVANNAGIPVVGNDPDYLDRGLLFAVGPGFYHSGRATAPLLARVLAGESPGTIPFEDVSQVTGGFNSAVAEKLKLAVPRSVIDGIQAGAAATNPGGKKWRIAVITYNETPPSEETLAGMDEGWSKSPLTAGKDYTLSLRNAQGDIAALSGIVDAALTEGADIVVPLSTPTLQACIQKIRDVPVVFSLVANPVAAGAGKSYTDHLSNVTGVSVLGPAGEMLDMLEKYYPSYRRFGTLFCPAETNSVDLKDSLAAMCRERGLTLEAVAANSPGELPDAALSMISRPIDAVLQISDNLSSSGFVAIARAAKQARVPLFSLNSTTVPLGAPIAMGRDYHEAGRQTVRMIERIIAGETPVSIPFLLPPKVVRTVSLPNAKAVGMTIPDGLIKEADVVVK